jgi:hypothetical protein
MSAAVRVSFLCLVGCATLLAGCGKKTNNGAKPAKNTKAPIQEENKGPHGGHLFDVGEGHKYKGELALSTKPRKLELYLIDHNEPTKAVVSGSKAITITSIKHDGKPLPDITLDGDPLKSDKDGCSHFVASGDKLPKEIDDVGELNGAKLKVLIAGKEVEATIEAEHHHD